MRIFLIAAAGLMLAPLSASACEVNFTDIEASVPAIAVPAPAVQEVSVAASVAAVPVADDLSAAKKKKEKDEYMKSAAGPEPTAKKAKKSKKKKKTKK